MNEQGHQFFTSVQFWLTSPLFLVAYIVCDKIGSTRHFLHPHPCFMSTLISGLMVSHDAVRTTCVIYCRTSPACFNFLLAIGNEFFEALALNM